jgi:hypothetical protein
MAVGAMYETETRSLSIARPVQEVYALLLDPANYPAWGFAGSASAQHISGTDWEMETSIGPRIIRFSPRNPHGVLDIAVRTEPEGPDVPMGVWAVPNGAGTELVLTLFRPPQADEAEWASLRNWLAVDFLSLQSVLEARGRIEPVQEARVVSLSVTRPLKEVYDFLAEPGNFASWAFVDNAMMEPIGPDEWSVETSVGRRFMKFQPRNRHGILSYEARASLEDPPHLIPMRVLANSTGTEIIYVFIRRPDAADEAFTSLVEWVTSDLLALKSILEASAVPLR